MKKTAKSLPFCLLACIILLFSCSPSKNGLLDYQSSPLEIELCGKANGVEFSAALTLEAPSDSPARPFRLTLLSPETLSGISFVGDLQGNLQIECEGLSIPLEAKDCLPAVRIAQLFSLAEEATSIRQCKGADIGLLQYESLTRLELASATVFIDPTTDTPVKIISDGIEITITSFNKKS